MFLRAEHKHFEQRDVSLSSILKKAGACQSCKYLFALNRDRSWGQIEMLLKILQIMLFITDSGVESLRLKTWLKNIPQQCQHHYQSAVNLACADHRRMNNSISMRFMTTCRHWNKEYIIWQWNQRKNCNSLRREEGRQSRWWIRMTLALNYRLGILSFLLLFLLTSVLLPVLKGWTFPASSPSSSAHEGWGGEDSNGQGRRFPMKRGGMWHQCGNEGGGTASSLMQLQE